MRDQQYKEAHADAIWSDVRDTHYGRAELRRHTQDVNGRKGWRFPYEDRVYVAYRPTTVSPTWNVGLWLAPYSNPVLGLPRDAATAPAVQQVPLIVGAKTLRDAVRGVALQLQGTRCDHEYTRGQDSCPGCDMLDDDYDDLP